MRSAMPSNQWSRCSEMSTVRPSAFHFATIFRRSPMEAKSRLEDGSSRTRTSGSSIVAEPQATRCFSPPESERQLRLIRSVSSSALATSFKRVRILSGVIPWFSHANASSPVVSKQKNWVLGFWKTDPTFGASSQSSWLEGVRPQTSIFPESFPS